MADERRGPAASHPSWIFARSGCMALALQIGHSIWGELISSRRTRPQGKGIIRRSAAIPPQDQKHRSKTRSCRVVRRNSKHATGLPVGQPATWTVAQRTKEALTCC